MNTEINGSSQISQTGPDVATSASLHSTISSSERTMTIPRAKDPLMKRLIRWICPDQRLSNRHSMPPVTAWLGMVRSSKEYKVGDISVAGFYMLTEERWIPGTSFPITLERTDESNLGKMLTVQATVVRTGSDGVGFSFVPNAAELTADGQTDTNIRIDLTKLAQFLKGLPMSAPDSEQFERAS